jgi:hypothetical protein
MNRVAVSSCIKKPAAFAAGFFNVRTGLILNEFYAGIISGNFGNINAPG